MRLTRRRLLAGGAAVAGGVGGTGALVEYDVLPWRTRAYDVLGLNGEPGVVPDVTGGPIHRGRLEGAQWLVLEPPDPEPGLPVVVALHAAGRDVDALVGRLALDRFLAASGERFVLAAIDGDSSYWHPRDDVTDTGGLVLDRFLPLLADRGYDVRRPGFLGWSMGGYGAMLLATERVERDEPVGPVAATSPAVFDEFTPRAFDDDDDFAAFGMFARRHLLAGLDVRVDCGRGDPFYRTVTSFVDGLHAEVHFTPGAHDTAYWTRVLPAQLTWLGERLSGAAPR